MNCRNILNNRTVTLLFLAAAALYFGRGVFNCSNQFWLDTTKALPVMLLGVTTWLYGGNKLLPIAMLLSAAGDIAGEHGAFLWQIGFFAAAHISFITYFVSRASFKRSRVWMLALWCTLFLLFGGFIVRTLAISPSALPARHTYLTSARWLPLHSLSTLPANGVTQLLH